MYRNILVPVDGSPFAEHALPLALSVARRAEARVQLVQVHVPFGYVDAEGYSYVALAFDAQEKARHRAYLDQLVERIKDVSDVPATATFLEGDVVPTLRATAVSTETDLVVMTTHGRGPLQRFWLGSVTDALVRELPMPLLLLRPKERPVELAGEPALRHFLLPLDGTALAEQVVKPMLDLGQLLEADYTLLRVVQPASPVAYQLESHELGEPAETMLARIEEAQERQCGDAADYLERVAGRLRTEGSRVQTCVVSDLHPAHAILEQIANANVDLVAVATHGRRGLSRLLLGSVADKVLRGATVPLLVYRPPYQ
jgi:nucleotide-binding universal stress UspA family protein